MANLRDSKFIISCPARSGSTMLVHLLRSNPQILCHGEVFGGEKIGHLYGHYALKRKLDASVDGQLMRYRMERPEAFLYDIVFDSQGHRTVGFKFKTDEAFDPRYRDVHELIQRDTDIKVIHLRRRNLLDQYISHQVVLRQTGVTLVTSEEAIPEVARFSIDVPEAMKYFLDVLKMEKQAVETYADHRRAVVEYEDLIQDGHPIRDRLQTFLGFEPVPLTTATRKILKRNFDLVQNLDEVVETMVRSGLSDRCLVEATSA